MAFRATNVITSDAYLLIKRNATTLNNNLQKSSDYMSANDIDYDYIRAIYSGLVRSKNQLVLLGTTPGLDAYAKDQENDQAYDFTTEFNSLGVTINSAINWIDTNVPTSATVKDPVDWIDGGSMISNTFTPAQMSGLKTEIDAVITEII